MLVNNLSRWFSLKSRWYKADAQWLFSLKSTLDGLVTALFPQNQTTTNPDLLKKLYDLLDVYYMKYKDSKYQKTMHEFHQRNNKIIPSTIQKKVWQYKVALLYIQTSSKFLSNQKKFDENETMIIFSERKNDILT